MSSPFLYELSFFFYTGCGSWSRSENERQGWDPRDGGEACIFSKVNYKNAENVPSHVL